MAMVQSLFTSVTGMQGAQTVLNVVGNNLANLGTTAFKASRVDFGDLLSQSLASVRGPDPSQHLGGVNPAQLGTGLTTSAITTDMTQGTIQTTGLATDLALNGDGFFVTKSGGSTVYTRDGSFRFDAQGNLVTPSGATVQGWMAQASKSSPLAPLVLDTSNPATIGNIQIASGLTEQAHETTQVSFTGNLDAGATPAVLGLPLMQAVDNVPVTTTVTTTIYDSLGNQHALTMSLRNVSGITDNTAYPETGGVVLNTRIPNNVWRFDFSLDPSDKTAALAPDGTFVGQPSPTAPGTPGQFQMFAKSGYLVFDTNGSLQEVRWGRQFDYPLGTWPQENMTYTTTAWGGPPIAYKMAPAPLLLLTQNIPEANAPGVSAAQPNAVPTGISAGLTVQQRFPALTQLSGGYNLLMLEQQVPVPEATMGFPASLNGHLLGNVIAQMDVPTDPSPTSGPLASATFSSTGNIDYTGQAPEADFFTQEITPFFGTGGTLSGGVRLTAPLSVDGATQTYTFSTVSGGSRDGLTQDRTGGFQTVNGSPTYVPLNTAHTLKQDGYTEGVLQTVAVDATGRLMGSFSNGQTLALAQVALAGFQNPKGLRRVGENGFEDSANSGAAVVGTAGDGGRGTIAAGALEQSNTDAVAALTLMMAGQRTFEANSRILNVSDQILDTLANNLRGVQS